MPFLEEVLPRITGNKLIFLDAHFAGGADFGLVDYARSATDPRSFPLLDELQALQPCLKADDILLIDDVHIYVPGSFQQGECPEFARRWHENAALFHALSFWRDTHVQTTLKNDEGYILLLPKCWQERFPSWLNILPHDATGQKLQISPGVRGATSTSIQRRICDARFATRYFRGDGIDVGGGGDSLVLFKELFPQVRHMFVYDQAHGDGQLLQNVPDETFDFLYSSHCLEHLRDPVEALHHWLRVVKSGGYLVVQVPDEDLYEQGTWPSRFNSDHKLTFTLFKEKSWSPVSVNVIDLVKSAANKAKPLSLELVDGGYRYQLQGKGFDQTSTPLVEAGIEMILRKHQ